MVVDVDVVVVEVVEVVDTASQQVRRHALPNNWHNCPDTTSPHCLAAKTSIAPTQGSLVTLVDVDVVLVEVVVLVVLSQPKQARSHAPDRSEAHEPP